jgi:hypothetical protein
MGFEGFIARKDNEDFTVSHPYQSGMNFQLQVTVSSST